MGRPVSTVGPDPAGLDEAAPPGDGTLEGLVTGVLPAVAFFEGGEEEIPDALGFGDEVEVAGELAAVEVDSVVDEAPAPETEVTAAPVAGVLFFL